MIAVVVVLQENEIDTDPVSGQDISFPRPPGEFRRHARDHTTPDPAPALRDGTRGVDVLPDGCPKIDITCGR
jgi:hypothetical protein